MRNSEIISTSKSPEEIRMLIARKTEQATPWSLNVSLKLGFYHKFEGNLIHLMAVGVIYWPFTELELNQYIEPRLRVSYSGYPIFMVCYCLCLFLFLLKGIELENWNHMIGFGCLLILFALIPVYINFVQRNTRNWLSELLRDTEQ